MPPQGVLLPRSRLVAAVGDVSDPRTWSGIPFHFFQAARGAGLVDEPLALVAAGRSVGLRRLIWNLRQVLSGGGKGGFQYSDRFLEAMWARERVRLSGSRVLNCFQLYPSSVTRDPSVEKWFFIDQTLTQLFDYYEQRGLIGARIAEDAIRRETQGYRVAAGVIVHSEWAKRSVVDDYGIKPSKVHVVVAGASLDADLLAGLDRKPQRSLGTEPLRLVFVGKEWARKGLDRLLRALRVAREDGCAITLSVIGCSRDSLPEELRMVDGVDWMGFIDKQKDEKHFVGALRQADVGCLLSRYEAGGIALREYHALGLPVIGPATGGAPEHMIPEASIAVAPSATDEEVAQILIDLAENRQLLASMTDVAWELRASATWAGSMTSFADVWPYPSDG